MNNVNRPIPVTVAHKLRSAVAAILADASNQPPRLAYVLAQEAAIINSRADQIEAGVVVEPTEFGSLVRARYPGNQSEPYLWQKSVLNGVHYWVAENSAVEVWSELTDVEVLRIGLGDEPNLDKVREEAWNEGARELAAEVHRSLQKLLADAITGERKNAFEKAIQAVEDLAP